MKIRATLFSLICTLSLTTEARAVALESGECPIRDPKTFYRFYYPRKIDKKTAHLAEEWLENRQDLNGDGTEELFIANRTGCKAQSGCTTVIFQLQKADCYRTLGSIEGKYTVTSRMKNGYFEIEPDPKKNESLIFEPSSSEYEKKTIAREN
jgi:hypothetical protein